MSNVWFILYSLFMFLIFFVSGVGVPILLAYVYGVVPISLCRSGGCGVTTTQAGGVHINIEETEGATNIGTNEAR